MTELMRPVAINHIRRHLVNLWSYLDRLSYDFSLYVDWVWTGARILLLWQIYSYTNKIRTV